MCIRSPEKLIELERTPQSQVVLRIWTAKSTTLSSYSI